MGAAHLAAGDCAPALRALLDAGAAIEARDLNKWACLHYAAWNGNLESIRILLAQGARPNMKVILNPKP